MIYIYQFIGLILIPLIKLNIKIRIKQKKEEIYRYKERYGLSNYKRKNNKKIIWIHAASIGEFKSADYFIKKYHEQFTILITTTTLSASNYAKEKYGHIILHQFAPLDVSIWVTKFLKNWQPKIVIWIESDLWPITLHTIKKNKIPAILVNVRLSPKSFKRWKIIPGFYGNIMNCFSKVFAQSKIDQKRIQSLSKKTIYYIGNLKLTTPNFYLAEKTTTKMNNDPNIIKIMLASTHDTEENLLLPILKNLITKQEKLQIIIAPRHPERSKQIISLCSSHNLSYQFASEKKINNKNVIIIDSFGILYKFFSISDIVFLGGSLIPAGGHNPIEPAVNKCAILTGSHIFNWQNIFNEMIENQACIKVNSLEDLKINLINLINDKNKLQEMKNNAYNFSQKQFIDIKILDNIINHHMHLTIC